LKVADKKRVGQQVAVQSEAAKLVSCAVLKSETREATLAEKVFWMQKIPSSVVVSSLFIHLHFSSTFCKN